MLEFHVHCYLHRRSIRISNFQKNKENAEEAFFCNSYRFSDTMCQAVGCTGPCKCNNDVIECLWRWSKSRQKSRTCWKAAKTISCYLKPGGKVISGLKSVRGRVISQSWRQNSKPKSVDPPENSSSLPLVLVFPPFLFFCPRKKTTILRTRKACWSCLQAPHCADGKTEARRERIWSTRYRGS